MVTYVLDLSNYENNDPATNTYQLYGHCWDYSNVLVGLARALGLPSRIYSFTGEISTQEFVHVSTHIWLDDTFSQDGACWTVFDATKIPGEEKYPGSSIWSSELIDDPVSAYWELLWTLEESVEYDSYCVFSPSWTPSQSGTISTTKIVDLMPIYSNIEYDPEISMMETVTRWMSYGDREYFRLDLTGEIHDVVLTVTGNHPRFPETMWSSALYVDGERYPYYVEYDNDNQHCLYHATHIATPTVGSKVVTMALPGGAEYFILVAPYLKDANIAHGNVWEMTITAEYEP